MITVLLTIKSKSKNAKWVGLVIDSLMAKHLWSYLYVTTIDKLNPLWTWHVSTRHPWQQWVN